MSAAVLNSRRIQPRLLQTGVVAGLALVQIGYYFAEERVLQSRSADQKVPLEAVAGNPSAGYRTLSAAAGSPLVGTAWLAVAAVLGTVAGKYLVVL
jgi:hypothetical protein